jgi:hypothetical protein
MRCVIYTLVAIINHWFLPNMMRLLVTRINIKTKAKFGVCIAASGPEVLLHCEQKCVIVVYVRGSSSCCLGAGLLI